MLWTEGALDPGKSVFSELLEAVWGFVLSRSEGVKQVRLCRKAEVNIRPERYPKGWLTWAVFLTCSARKITQDCSVVKMNSSEHKGAIKFFGAWWVHGFHTCLGTAYSVWLAPYHFQSTGHLPSLSIWKKKCHKEQKQTLKNGTSWNDPIVGIVQSHVFFKQ